jgi:glyoxylase-like metal-dependent hydrolase (beta-lactamase superfamily II)
MQVAPGVERVNEFVINCYLVEEAGSLTLVDAGVGGNWDLLMAGLAGIGRSIGDIEAILLTHAHVDHIGMADRVRREAPATVAIHEGDLAPLLAGRRPPNAPDHPAGMGSTLLHGHAYRLLWYLLRRGGLSIPSVAVASGFADGQVLDVPGHPRVVHVPGHTPGSAALAFEDRGAVCVGDALVTLNAVTGSTGPRLAPAAFSSDPAAARASLGRLAGLEADVVLPGHGEPFHGSPAAAVDLARDADGGRA